MRLCEVCCACPGQHISQSSNKPPAAAGGQKGWATTHGTCPTGSVDLLLEAENHTVPRHWLRQQTQAAGPWLPCLPRIASKADELTALGMHSAPAGRRRLVVG